ncbi:MAG: hypothetical protein H7177_02150 [Rhizobacter sp.]|nr:hypothetical protein [Bacteriovorax sp.]
MMNKLLFTILISLAAVSCSTYVPVEYRTAGEYVVAKNTALKISDAEKKDLTSKLQKEIIKDGWWKYGSNDKSFYEITITEVTRNGAETSSSNQVRDGKTFRKSNYKASGTVVFNIKRNDGKNARTFSLETSGYAESEKEMPKEYGANSLWPILNALVGADPTQEAISSQVTFVSLDAYNNLDQNMAVAIVNKISPEKKIVNIEFEDGNNDLEPAEKFVKLQDYLSAFNYLLGLPNSDTRSDVQYNLGVVQEARHLYKEACSYYQKAYGIEGKRMYLEQMSGCETRKTESEKLDKII